MRQLESFLKFFQHALHVRLEYAKALFKRELRVLVYKIDHVALLAALWIVDLYPTTFSFRECLLQQFAIFEVYRHVDLARHVIRCVVLRENITQKLSRIESIFRQVFPEKLSPADDVAFTHREELQCEPLSFTVITKNIDVAFRSRRHLLLFGKPDHSLTKIAILCRQ